MNIIKNNTNNQRMIRSVSTNNIEYTPNTHNAKNLSRNNRGENDKNPISQQRKDSQKDKNNLIHQFPENQHQVRQDMIQFSKDYEKPRFLSPDNRELSPSKRKLLPDKTDKFANKKTLIIDLDETLVHSSFRPFNRKPDLSLKIQLDQTVHDIYVLIRPGTKEFLEKLSSMYELVIFTASLSNVRFIILSMLIP